jgi:hypothetical protein
MKAVIDNKDTYLAPFIMTLSCILRLYGGASLIEFGFLQVEASRGCQSAI